MIPERSRTRHFLHPYHEEMWWIVRVRSNRCSKPAFWFSLEALFSFSFVPPDILATFTGVLQYRGGPLLYFGFWICARLRSQRSGFPPFRDMRYFRRTFCSWRRFGWFQSKHSLRSRDLPEDVLESAFSLFLPTVAWTISRFLSFPFLKEGR